MSSSLYQIDKLDGSNYDSWAIQMKSVLIHSGQWHIVNGSTKVESFIEAKEKANFQVEDEKALATICLSVKASQLNYIKKQHDITSSLDGIGRCL